MVKFLMEKFVGSNLTDYASLVLDIVTADVGPCRST